MPSPGGLILVAAQDAGGARALVPVLELLRERGRSLKAWADGPALTVLSRSGFAPVELSFPRAASALPEAFEAGPELVLVGNSVGPSLEDAFVMEARRRGVPSVGVLDSWLLYDRKFSGASGPWACLPDTLVVMDEHAKAEMAALGAPVERLLPLGQPQFDRLESCRVAPERRAEVRKGLGVTEGGRLLLFLSQDMENFYGGREDALATLGYTEYTALECLRAALAEVSARAPGPVGLAVKLHPREAESKFSELGRAVKDRDPYELILSSDLAVGMDTILLVEAGLLGVPTLSLQPGRRGIDTLITNRLGLGSACYDHKRLPSMLESLLFDEKARLENVSSMRRFPVRSGAAKRVADWVLGRSAAGVQ